MATYFQCPETGTEKRSLISLDSEEMKTGWYILNVGVRISKYVFWPVFLAVFSCLFFVAEVIICCNVLDLAGARTWGYMFRECGSVFDSGVGEWGPVVLAVIFGILNLAILAFIVALVPAAIIAAVATLITQTKSRGEEPASVSSSGPDRRLVSLISAVLMGIMIILLWERLPCESIRKLIRPLEDLALYLIFPAVYLVVSLLFALVYRRHQPVAGWERIIFVLYVGLCLAIGIPSSIQKYEWAKQAEAEMEWMNNEMERNMARMEALHSFGQTNELQDSTLPLDEPSQYWRYSLMDRDGNATLDMNGVTIVFEGVTCSGMSGGGIQISGPGHGFTSTGSGGREFSEFYRNGVAVFTFAGHSFRLMQQGKILAVGEQEFRLDTGKPTLLISTDGTIRIRKTDEEESNKEMHPTN